MLFKTQVWDQDDQGTWSLTASWKAHSGSVWKVTWAHPEFGQVLATCSFDRTAAIWEEISMFLRIISIMVYLDVLERLMYCFVFYFHLKNLQSQIIILS